MVHRNTFVRMISGLCSVDDVMALARARATAAASAKERRRLLGQLRQAQVAWWGDRRRDREFPRGTPFDGAIDILVARASGD